MASLDRAPAPDRRTRRLDHTIGVWATTERPKVTVRTVLANQTVRVKVGKKTYTRTVKVRKAGVEPGHAGPEATFQTFYENPILAAVINKLYPGLINAPRAVATTSSRSCSTLCPA